MYKIDIFCYIKFVKYHRYNDMPLHCKKKQKTRKQTKTKKHTKSVWLYFYELTAFICFCYMKYCLNVPEFWIWPFVKLKWVIFPSDIYRAFCAKCGVDDEHAWSMLNIHTPRKILLFYPRCTSRKCILSVLINLPQHGLLGIFNIIAFGQQKVITILLFDENDISPFVSNLENKSY